MEPCTFRLLEMEIARCHGHFLFLQVGGSKTEAGGDGHLPKLARLGCTNTLRQNPSRSCKGEGMQSKCLMGKLARLHVTLSTA
jgi:hypothetical protein